MSEGTAARVTFNDAMSAGERSAMLCRHSVAKERNIDNEMSRELDAGDTESVECSNKGKGRTLWSEDFQHGPSCTLFLLVFLARIRVC